MTAQGITHYRRSNVEYKEPLASNLTRDEVEKYADLVAEATEFGTGTEIVGLVSMLGGKLHYQEIDSWAQESGSIFVHNQFDFDILLPSYTSPRRDRFTIAHELGHYFLHSNQGKRAIIAKRQGTGRIEWEANWFAAALLMPAKEFRAVCKEVGNDAGLVSMRFRVSRDAATVRMRVLGCA